ncbi:Hsp70 family protein [Pseudofrankia sp. DC12]|uniref:Hsp70 family protein n=1 Tax=Pseudofrankia sp. DC12 TaxID=683315 RepID=UPI0005F76539|nr:Hsp70 family protein [Pseudofrankia sp. DC12]
MGYQLGIDIGTANTTVAVASGDWPQILTVAGGPSIPTVLYFPAGAPVVFGRAAARRALAEPSRAAHGFLRRIGDSAPVMAGGSAYTPEGLVTRFLDRVLASVTENRGEAPDQVVVTYPTSWTSRRRELFTEALERLDVDVPVRAVPAADALGAVLARRAAARTPGRGADLIAVYDFGAGACEAAVLSVSDYGAEVAGTPAGMAGVEIDDLLLEHVLAASGVDVALLDRTEPATAAALGRLRAEVVAAKETLAADDEASVPVTLPGAFAWVTLRREDLERLVTPAVEDSVRVLARTVRSVPTTAGGLSSVLLYGGLARMPLVGQLVRAALPGARRFEEPPAEDLAIGAALLAIGLAEQAEPPAGGETAVIGGATLEPPELSSFPGVSLPPSGALAGAGAAVPFAAASGPDDADATALITAAYESFPAGAAATAGGTQPTGLAAWSTGAAAAAPPSGGAAGPAAASGGAAGGRNRRRRGGLGALRSAGGIAALVAAVVFIAGGTTLGVVLTQGGGNDTAAVQATTAPAVAPATVTAPTTAAAAPSRNVVRVADSDEVAPILEKASQELASSQPNVTVAFDSTVTDTTTAFAKLCSGEAAIAGASFELDPKFAPDPSCKDKVVGFEIAHHTLPIIVNPANTWLGCLNLTQLKSIWAPGSTITRWNQINKSYPDEPINFVGPAKNTVQAEVFNSSINGDSTKSRDYTVRDLGGVAQTVLSDKDAIGFLDFPTFETLGAQLRGVLVNGGSGCEPPNAITAGTGVYTPLCKPLYVYVRTDALRDPATAAYMKFFLENEQSIAQVSHYVPRDDATVKENIDKVNSLTQGVGPVPA